MGHFGDFPGCTVVKTLYSQFRGPRFDPWSGMLCYAKSLQLCPTLCDPIDGSPPGSPVPGILQARTSEWVATSFSNAWKWKVKAKLLSRVRLLATPWTAAYQAPPSMGFSRQKYWSGVQGSRPHLLQLKVPHAATKTCCSQIKKRRKRGLFYASAFPRGLLIYFPLVYVTLHFLEFYGHGIIHCVLYHLFILDLLIFIIGWQSTQAVERDIWRMIF